MPITPVTVYAGDVPDRSTQSPNTFTNNAIDWTDYQANTLIPGINKTVAEINAVATQIDADKIAAAQSANNAKNNAESAQAASNFKGEWSSLTGALNKPASVYHNGVFWLLLNDLADVTASEPSATNSDWLLNNINRWGALITSSATLNTNSLNPIYATSAAVDLTQPTFTAGDFLVIGNSPESTETVRLLNPSNTIVGATGTISAGDNLVLEAGDTVNLYARTSTILEVK